MKVVSIISLIVSIAALALVLQKKAAEPTIFKPGFVRSGYLLEKAVITAEASQKLTAERDEISKNLKKLEDEMSAGHEAFIKDQETMSSDAKKKRVGELAKLEQDLNRYAVETREKIAAREQEIMAPVLQIINARISQFAKENGYTMIWGVGDGNILYGDLAVDITEEVLTYINEQK